MMNNLDECLVHLIRHFRGKILSLHSLLKRRPDHVDYEYISGQIVAYAKVIQDLEKLF